MNAYLRPEVARALLQQSRDYTQRMRAQKERKRLTDAAFAQFSRIGWGHAAAAELAAIYVKSEEAK
jgi:hypothetical protein